jgi:hypothetical protein
VIHTGLFGIIPNAQLSCVESFHGIVPNIQSICTKFMRSMPPKEVGHPISGVSHEIGLLRWFGILPNALLSCFEIDEFVSVRSPGSDIRDTVRTYEH